MALPYTYTSLKTALYDYLQVQGEAYFLAHVNEFIGLGESRIAREVDTPDQQFQATGALAATTGVILAPLNFISPITLLVAPGAGTNFTPLLLKDETFLYEGYGLDLLGGSPSGSYGTPKYYAIQGADFDPQDVPITAGARIILGPPVDIDYLYQLSYRKKPDTLVGQGLTSPYSTWVATYYPQALLWACVCEGYMFMKGDLAQKAEYEKYLISAIAEMKMGMGQQAYDQFRKSPPPAPPEAPAPQGQ